MSDKLRIISKPAISIFSFFVLMQLTTWLPLRYWRVWGGGNFIDSQQILQWSECYELQGNSVFESHGECSGYIYGSTLLRILSFLNFSTTASQVVGYFLMMILALAISYKMNSFDNYRADPFIILIVLSPPILLLAERANFDILILALVMLAALLFGRNYHFCALLPLALATLLKFYTLPLFLIFFLLNNSKRRKLTTFLITALVTSRVFFDLELIKSSWPTGFSWKFGVSIWTRYLTQLNISDPGELMNNLSGLLIFFVIFALTIVVLKKMKVSTSPEQRGSKHDRVFFYMLFGAHLTCFSLGMSFDYRLVFFAISSIVYLKVFSAKGELLRKIVLVMVIPSLWLTYPSSGLEPIGDFMTEVVTVIFTIQFLQLLRFDLKSQNAK